VLGSKIHAEEALPAIAGRLADADPLVRSSALHAMDVLTHQPACSVPEDQVIAPRVRECLAWWNRAGQRRAGLSLK
jgi:hypothetical protein